MSRPTYLQTINAQLADSLHHQAWVHGTLPAVARCMAHELRRANPPRDRLKAALERICRRHSVTEATARAVIGNILQVRIALEEVAA